MVKLPRTAQFSVGQLRSRVSSCLHLPTLFQLVPQAVSDLLRDAQATDENTVSCTEIFTDGSPLIPRAFKSAQCSLLVAGCQSAGPSECWWKEAEKQAKVYRWKAVTANVLTFQPAAPVAADLRSRSVLLTWKSTLQAYRKVGRDPAPHVRSVSAFWCRLLRTEGPGVRHDFRVSRHEELWMTLQSRSPSTSNQKKHRSHGCAGLAEPVVGGTVVWWEAGRRGVLFGSQGSVAVG